MKRRKFVIVSGITTIFIFLQQRLSLPAEAPLKQVGPMSRTIEWKAKTNPEWKNLLTSEQYRILREEGTERPWSSSLNYEKRPGVYACAGCKQELFHSNMKFDSGTGWPSFHDFIKGTIETKRDFKLIFPRTEYHCSRCLGHQGHVFNDGPKPTGKRYCNNGVALIFTATEG